MRKYALFLICFTFSVVAMSQKAVISFEEKTYDFGKINEEDGKVTHVFEFINKGTTPLVINRVVATCGCTTPMWTKEPIGPGKKGTITVTYNPIGRPGAISKAITVYSNATDEQFVLNIRGEVIPKAIADNNPYPINMGGLGLKTKVVQMNNIEKGKTQIRTLDIRNTTKSPLKVLIDNVPAYLTCEVSPETLKSNETGKIIITFNSKLCTQWGPVTDELFLVVNGVRKTTDDIKLIVIGNIVEDFSKLTIEQRRITPIIEIANRTLDLETLRSGANKIGKIKLSNKGQSSLEIRRLLNNNKELLIKAQKTSIGAGKNTEIIVQLNTKDLTSGDYKRTFTLQTNDPENPYILLIVSWKIK